MSLSLDLTWFLSWAVLFLLAFYRYHHYFHKIVSFLSLHCLANQKYGDWLKMGLVKTVLPLMASLGRGVKKYVRRVPS